MVAGVDRRGGALSLSRSEHLRRPLAQQADLTVGRVAVEHLARSAEASTWASQVERGLVRVATVPRLEVGCPSRSGRNLRTAAVTPSTSPVPIEHQTPAVEDRAVEVQMMLGTLGCTGRCP